MWGESLKSTPTRESTTFQTTESRRIRTISDSDFIGSEKIYYEEKLSNNYVNYNESESLLNGSLNELLGEHLLRVNLPNTK